MYFRKVRKALLFPHIAILFVLLPVATVLLVYQMEDDSRAKTRERVLNFYDYEQQ